MGDLILVLIFTIIICSFILYGVIKNAIDNSTISKKLDAVEIQLTELKQLIEKTSKGKL